MSITAVDRWYVICYPNQSVMTLGSLTNCDRRQNMTQLFDLNNKSDSAPDKPRLLDVVRDTLRHYFEDVRSGQFPVRMGDIIVKR